ncbi:MAG: type II toxin-antitoxin system Phd/YefM family antitoxin [Caldilineaceae bacterium]|nr:type II toxin-antitoxin system Phd/YefM family antitoxin [Caldilineaceae bacterium]
MSNVWQVQEARARFSELLEASHAEGPQIVTKHGKETAVVVSIEQWRRLERVAKPSLKAFLLAPEPRTEALTPPRRKLRRRPAPDLE